MADRSAVIDIGSNTIRLVVYNGPPRAPIVLLNEKVTPRLGKDVARDGAISEKSMEFALAALGRYSAMLRLMKVDEVETVATAAVRDAANGSDFLRAVRDLGLSPRLLSGEEEARTSAMGVISAFPGAFGVAGDLGGGSLELTRIGDGRCKGGISLPFGSLRLADLRADGPERFGQLVRQALSEAGWKYGKGQPFFIVGGSWRALALYAMTHQQWPIDDPHGFELTAEKTLEICGALAKRGLELDVPRISSSRRATLPDAAALLMTLAETITPSSIVFSSWGLREGLLYNRLDAATQALDPMVAGIAAFAETCNVSSTVAKDVAGWIAGADSTDEHDGSLRLAACMLSLAAIRTEPNMRVQEAMGWALRKRWIGLDARGRAMLAMAVLANSGQTDVPEEFAGLARKGDLKTAIGWGLAIRLCRRLTGCTPGGLEDTSLFEDQGKLVLSMANELESLFSNSAAKDLRNLADWLGLEPSIQIAAKKKGEV